MNRRSRPGLLFALILTGFAGSPMAAQARGPNRQEETPLETAGDIASQPARDIGAAKTRIPPVLTDAANNPYARPGDGRCPAVLAAWQGLNEALGPDFGDDEAENENRVGKIAEAGGKMIVNSLIPFRGLVREVSGAAPAERRLQAAIGAGLARRGYLRGLAQMRKCPLPADAAAPQPAAAKD